MGGTRLALIACAALSTLVVPSTVAAAGPADNYLFGVSDGAVRLNAPGEPLPIQFSELDNTGATLQFDLFSPGPAGGPSEEGDCGGGKAIESTLWREFYPPKDGTATIAVTFNDSVDWLFRLVPFDPLTNEPDQSLPCADDHVSAPGGEVLTTRVVGGGAYKLQIGSGLLSDTGAASLVLVYTPDADPPATITTTSPTIVTPASIVLQTSKKCKKSKKRKKRGKKRKCKK